MGMGWGGQFVCVCVCGGGRHLFLFQKQTSSFYCILDRNTVDPYQTPCSVASELGLHCLHNNRKEVAGLI